MPRTDLPGQALMFSPADCPREPADGPPLRARLSWQSWRELRDAADARRTEALRKRDERREARR